MAERAVVVELLKMPVVELTTAPTAQKTVVVELMEVSTAEIGIFVEVAVFQIV